MFCTTVIATLGRASLSRSVKSVLQQNLKSREFEIIVINDSGQPLPKADWQKSSNVKIVQNQRREKCFARNTGAAIAKGEYLHFLDDDDWLLPGAMRELRSVVQKSGAIWVYGTSRLVDEHEQILIDHHVGVSGNTFTQVMSGEWIPLQASLIKTEIFFQVNGFDPRLTVSEDKDLCRRVALHYDLANTRMPVVCILRDRKQSYTDYHLATPYSVWSRDNILSECGAFKRMRTSARNAYWQGRLVRAYLTCVAWNLQKKNFFIAASRGIWAALGLLLSGKNVFAPSFWHALVRSHSRENVF